MNSYAGALNLKARAIALAQVTQQLNSEVTIDAKKLASLGMTIAALGCELLLFAKSRTYTDSDVEALVNNPAFHDFTQNTICASIDLACIIKGEAITFDQLNNMLDEAGKEGENETVQ
jgi:hypothetical protein